MIEFLDANGTRQTLDISQPFNVAFNADCMEFLKACPDKTFDLAVTDPPYGLDPSSSQGSGKLKDRTFNKGHIKEWDKAPPQEYFEELFRVSKNQVIWGGNYFPLPPCRCFIAWDKVQPWENFSQVEFAWTSFDAPAKLFRFDNRTTKKTHPTQKPVELYDFIYSRFANPGDKILDSHLGSGSSRIAAYDAGFSFAGLEISKEYFEMQEKRFDDHSAQENLFLLAGGDFG